MGFAQEIRRTEMPITGMRDKAGGRSWEGRKGLGIVIQNMFSLRCRFMKGVKAWSWQLQGWVRRGRGKEAEGEEKRCGGVNMYVAVYTLETRLHTRLENAGPSLTLGCTSTQGHATAGDSRSPPHRGEALHLWCRLEWPLHGINDS